MALEHLDDNEYEALKQRGLTALSDEAYERLKLPDGYGKPPVQKQPEVDKEKVARDLKEEGLVPQGPISTFAGLASAGINYLGQKAGIENAAEKQAGPLTSLSALQQVPKTDVETAATLAGGQVAETSVDAAKAVLNTRAGKATLQGLYKLGPNVYPKVSKYVLENWDRVFSAPSVKEATNQYIDTAASSGLKHVDKSIAKRFGEHVDPLKYYGQLEEEGKHIANQFIAQDGKAAFASGKGAKVTLTLPDGTPATAQNVLDSLQALNLEERSIPINIKEKTKIAKALDANHTATSALYDILDTSGVPELRDKARQMRDAYNKQAVMSVLPKNIAGDVNVLRPILALTGHAGPLAPFASPAVFTGTLRGLKAVGNNAKVKGAITGKALSSINNKEK